MTDRPFVDTYHNRQLTEILSLLLLLRKIANLGIVTYG